MSRGARAKPPPKGGKRPRKAPPKKARAAPSLRRRLLRVGLLLTLALGTLGALGVVGGYFYFVRDLPDIRSLRDYQPPQVSRMFAADGTLIGEFFTERRTVVGRDRIPDVMVHAILSAEDADFYQHEGLDFTGMLRALYNSLRAGHITGSGSTITQQTVKNLVLSPEKRFERKAKELILARRLEAHLSKDDILTIYLNAIYFGHGRYGVQEAARFFWGKDVSELTLPEAAMLAGVVQSPERLSPRKHPERAAERRAYVLDQMVKNGHVGRAEAEAAKKAPFGLVEPPPSAPLAMRWFVDAARDEVTELVGADALNTGGLRIHTTLDPQRQEAAVAALQDGLKALDARQGFGRPEKKTVAEAAWRKASTAKLKGKPPAPGVPARARIEAVTEKGLEVDLGVGRARVRRRDAARFADEKGALPYAVGQIVTVQVRADGPAFPKRMDAILAGVPEAAMVVLDPQTRDVLALVGGYDHRASPLNRAVQAHRQPGSAFKPFVWGAAFETKKYTPASRLVDAPETHHIGQGKFWTPKNYTGTFKGPITLRTALAKSVNSIAVSLIEDVGVSAVQDFARRATISSPLVDGPTLALGASEVTPLELVNAFATFAADGRVGQPRLVTKVVHADGREEPLGGEGDALQQGLDADVVWLLRDVMRSVVTEGSGSGLKGFPRPVVGKTGTSNAARDAWFVGLLPEVAVGAWVGFDRPRTLGRKEAGGRTALPIVKAYLEAMETKGPVWPPRPSGVVEEDIDPDSERLAPEGGPSVPEVFLVGTAPTETAPAAGQVDTGSFFFEEAGGPSLDVPTGGPALDVPTIGRAPVPDTLAPLPPAGDDDDPSAEDDEDRPL